MNDVTIQVDLSELKNFSQAIVPQINMAVQEVITQIMRSVYFESQQLVPVDTGDLKKSGRLKANTPNGQTPPQAEISYGSDKVHYALIVHENLQARHKAPTQAKYLEVPFVRRKSLFSTAIQDRIKILLGTQ